MWRRNSAILLTGLVSVQLQAWSGTPTLARGDSAFRALRYDEAVALYHEAMRSGEDSVSGLWRVARVLICTGDVEEGDRSQALYREAEQHARRAVQLDSLSADAHTWYAAALGSVALHVGGRTKIQLTHQILVELRRAIDLNPVNDIAYSILGSFYRALGGLSWFERQLASIFLGSLPEGGYEDGERALKKAIELNPSAPRHRYELGMLYLDWGKEELAREHLAVAVTLPIITARDTLNRSDARRRLNDSQGK